MPNQLSPMLEQRVLAFSLAQPGYGPKRIASELAPRSGVAFASRPTGCGGSCVAMVFDTRARRLGLVAGYAAPPELPERPPAPVRQIAISHPGELVQMGWFLIGRLSGATGTVWQYTAIDAHSSHLWAGLDTSPPKPDGPRHLTSCRARGRGSG